MKEITVDSINQAETELQAEHEALLGLYDQLKAAKDVAGLREVIEKTHQKLHEHMTHEEFPGGFYERMGACSKAFRDRVRRLVDDHYQLLCTVRDLRQRAASAGPDDFETLAADCLSFRAAALAHEAREDALAADAKAHLSG